MKQLGNSRLDRHEKAEPIFIDSAGAVKGGAARFLRELRQYLVTAGLPNVELIGLDERLTPKWLIKRELLTATAARRISLNNAGFVNPKGSNVTLLRNILHFATPKDLDSLAFRPSRQLRAQIPLIRSLARVSETLIVPCTRMAEQVATVSPSLTDKLTVRFHPVSQPVWAGTEPKEPLDVLLPIVPFPYKNLDQHIPEFLAASDKLPLGGPVRLIVPSGPEEFPSLAEHPRIRFIGLQTSEELDKWWKNSGAVFFPTEFESFGYALAEARVYGRSIIAQDTVQNREIAGSALMPYTRADNETLASAIEQALQTRPSPDPEPFDPRSYFDWLVT